MSKYVRDLSAGARAVSVACLGCGATLRLADALVDTEGPSFMAYYHPACAPRVVVDALRCGNTRDGLIADASDIGLKPGEWPDELVLRAAEPHVLRRGAPLSAGGQFCGYRYSSESGGQRLDVVND